MSTSPKYKLTYFNFRWIAEPTRYLLSYLGEDFEDVRHDWDAWEKHGVEKDNYPYGKLPYFEDKETGIKLSQSFTIVAYLGKKHNLAGSSDLEFAKCNEYADCLKDMLKEVETMFEAIEEKDEEKKAKIVKSLLEKSFPRYFSVIEKDLKGNGGKFLVGKSLTWVDILLAHYTELFERFVGESVLANYPTIKAHQKQFFDLPQIKAWIAKRPVTEY